MEQSNKYFDIQYIKKLMNGDDSAFEVIYEHYKNHIYYMGMQFFNHDSEKSKDLVQNTFSEIYINIKKLKAPEAFYVWMNRIAYRQGCNMLRYQSKDSTYYTNDVEENYIEQYMSDDNQEDLLSEIQKKEAVEIILDSLNEMDEDKRLVGYLRYFEELSLKEISQVTSMPENTVGSHLHRIKAKLKKKLEAKGFTSSACFSLLLVPNLISYFRVFVEKDEPIQGQSISDIKQKTLKNTVKKNDLKWMNLSKVILGVSIVVPTLIVGGTTFYNEQDNNNQLPVFTNVSYDQGIVNHPIKLNIETSNKNYDEILINNSTNLEIPFNGVYELKLTTKGKVVDSKKLTISNIDRDVPEVTKETIQEEKIIFELKDNLSGIDYEHIEYLVNGKLNQSIQVDKNKQKIIVPRNIKEKCQIKVPDNAGNVLNIKIDSYIISAN